MNYRKALAVLVLIGTLGLGADQAATYFKLNSELESTKVVEEVQANKNKAALDRNSELKAQTEELESTIELRKAVVSEREKFDASLITTAAALTAANSKVDSAPHRARAIAAQEAVVGKLEDAEIVTAQTKELDSIASELTEAVRAYDARVAQEAAQRNQAKAYNSGKSANTGGKTVAGGGKASSAPSPSVHSDAGASGGDWVNDMRARLNNVGGGHVQLSQDDNTCRGAVACAISGKGIVVSSSIKSFSDSRKNWAMAHELAHIYQFQVWGQLTSSGTYGSLFGSDPELLANCMASVKGYSNHGHSNQCNNSRLDFSRSMWNGVVTP